MAAADPYAPCPCGSGEKYKWCCQKAEPFAEKAQRLFENGQSEAALAAVDEGLRKHPGNPWLTIHKALYLLKKEKADQAQPILAQLVERYPEHAGAHLLLCQAVLAHEGLAGGINQVQRSLTALPPERRSALVTTLELIGNLLRELNHIPAARKHLELAVELAIERENEQPRAAILLKQLDAGPTTSPWLRDDQVLSPPPEGLDDATTDRFLDALRWAREGLWAVAAAAFEALAADGLSAADRNLGLCRLWLAEDKAAVTALRRWIARAGETSDAVDLELVCQLVAPPADLVELVHWIWSVRDRDRLLKALKASDRTVYEGIEQLDPNVPEAATIAVESFAVLDRPRLSGALPTDPRQVPKVVCRVLLGKEIVLLEGPDDGRLDRLSTWLSDLAGPAIPPAHPKSKVVNRVSRSALALHPELSLPEDAPAEPVEELAAEEAVWRCTVLWPETKLPYLGGRTPLQAAAAGDARVPLRAAVCQLEWDYAFNRIPIDFAALRARLNIPDEPAIDPQTVDVQRLALGRLHRVPAEQLDDDRLAALFQRALSHSLILALERAALAILERPELLRRPEPGVLQVYSALADVALARNDAALAQQRLEQGRQADPAARGANAVRWDLAGLRVETRSAPPEVWVPTLAVLLQRYGQDEAAMSLVFTNLIQMGLIRALPHPERPGEFLLDSRPLQAVLNEYGPRIATAAGTLGVGAAKGAIWTPDSAATTTGSTTSSGIWTPDAPASPSGEKKLILPS